MFAFSSGFLSNAKNISRFTFIAIAASALLSVIASVYLHSTNQENVAVRQQANLQHLEQMANDIIKDIVGADIRLKNHAHHVVDKTLFLNTFEQNQAVLLDRFKKFEARLENSSINHPNNAFRTQILALKTFVSNLKQRYEVLGVDQSSGLRGKMDLIAQRIAANQTIIHYPKLRHELELIKQDTAGFITMGDKQFAQSVELGLGRFNRLLGMAQTFGQGKFKTYQLVQNYKKTFHTYVLALNAFQNQIKQHEEVHQSLLSGVIGISNLAGGKIAQTKLAVNGLNQHRNRYQMILIALTVLFLAGAGIMVMRSVIVPLAKISNIHDVLTRNSRQFDRFHRRYGTALPNTN